ncbi:MAG: PEP-CTERM sorting domain-containing protein [Candidatus Thiodiazotropha sp. (ex. Lucinisca nassula)]|nr:PEP-CTERM sorting domain-containing protein [Candidatus Thiodiazotropha sp. (ex. Lucinisca nassula)]
MKFGIPQFIAAGLASLLLLGSAQAIPLYYSFEGSVASYPISDQSGFLGDVGLAAGDNVSFTFMIDKDRQGTRRGPNGELVEDQDRIFPGMQNGPGALENYILHDSFHVELVESSVFDLVQGLYPERGADDPWSGSGYSNSAYRNGLLDEGFGEVSLFGSSESLGSSSLYIYSDMSKWEIGTTLSADNMTALNGHQSGDRSTFRSDLRLTAISNVNPSASDASLVSGITGGAGTEGGMPRYSVPEPSTFLLMGLGLLGIGARRYFKSA